MTLAASNEDSTHSGECRGWHGISIRWDAWIKMKRCWVQEDWMLGQVDGMFVWS
jgi:hypothetical protein